MAIIRQLPTGVAVNKDTAAAILDVNGAGSTSATQTFAAHNSTGTNNAHVILDDGNNGFGVGTPTAVAHLKAGTATAGTAPLKFTSGTNLTTAEAGVMEYNGADLFFTPSGTTRRTIAYQTTVVAQSSTPLLVTSADNEKIYTNEGASAIIVFNLPTAVANLTYTFYVQDADGMQVVANTGDFITINGVASSSAGNASSTNIGSSLTLTAINATDWVATSTVGTWVLA